MTKDAEMSETFEGKSSKYSNNTWSLFYTHKIEQSKIEKARIFLLVLYFVFIFTQPRLFYKSLSIFSAAKIETKNVKTSKF